MTSTTKAPTPAASAANLRRQVDERRSELTLCRGKLQDVERACGDQLLGDVLPSAQATSDLLAERRALEAKIAGLERDLAYLEGEVLPRAEAAALTAEQEAAILALVKAHRALQVRSAADFARYTQGAQILAEVRASARDTQHERDRIESRLRTLGATSRLTKPVPGQFPSGRDLCTVPALKELPRPDGTSEYDRFHVEANIEREIREGRARSEVERAERRAALEAQGRAEHQAQLAREAQEQADAAARRAANLELLRTAPRPTVIVDGLPVSPPAY